MSRNSLSHSRAPGLLTLEWTHPSKLEDALLLSAHRRKCELWTRYNYNGHKLN